MTNSPASRRPFNVLQTAPVLASPSQRFEEQRSGLQSALKRSDNFDATPSLGRTTETPEAKKTKLNIKRVSFGENLVRLIESNDAHDQWHESPLGSIEDSGSFAPQQHEMAFREASPMPIQSLKKHSPHPSPAFLGSLQSASPRRSPRLAKKRKSISSPLFRSCEGENNDDNDDNDGENEDTVTLPRADDMLKEQVDLSDFKTSMEQSSRMMDETQSPTCASDDLFMDEDVTVGVEAPRISTFGGNGGDDTTMIQPFRQILNSVTNSVVDHEGRRDSFQSTLSDGDITQQIPGMTGLIDIDECYQDRGAAASRGKADFGFETDHAATESTTDMALAVGDVTAQALPLARLLQEDMATAGTSDDSSLEPDSHSIQTPIADICTSSQQSKNRELAESDTGEKMKQNKSSSALVECASPNSESDCSINDITMGVPSLSALADHDDIDCPAPDGRRNSQAETLQKQGPDFPTKSQQSIGMSHGLRPILPEIRQLFNAESHPDDDTLHYQEQQNTVEKLQQSTASASQQAPSDDATNDPSSLFRISDVLDTLLIQFRDDFKTVQRGASLGVRLSCAADGQNVNSDDKPSSKVCRTMRTAMMSQGVLRILDTSVEQITEEISRRKAQIAQSIEAVERDPPEYFARLGRGDKLKPADLSKMQLDFKRLRKASAMQAAKRHASLRSEREMSIAAVVCNQIAGLGVDFDVLSKSLESLSVECAKMQEAITNDGLDKYVVEAVSSHIDPVVTKSLQSEVTSHLDELRKANELLRTAGENKSRLDEENRALLEQNLSLRQEADELQKYAEASTVGKLQKLIGGHRDTHLLLAAVSGIKPIAFSRKEISVQLVGTVIVTFHLRNESVTKASYTMSHTTSSETQDAFAAFMNHFAALLYENLLSRVSRTHEIPAVLQLSVSSLMRLLNIQQDLARYQTLREAQFIPSVRRDNDPSCAEVFVKAEYYSTREGCKFSITFSLKAFAPESLSEWNDNVMLKLASIERLLGSTPSDEEIRSTVGHCASGTRGNNVSRFSLFESLQTVWTLL